MSDFAELDEVHQYLIGEDLSDEKMFTLVPVSKMVYNFIVLPITNSNGIKFDQNISKLIIFYLIFQMFPKARPRLANQGWMKHFG